MGPPCCRPWASRVTMAQTAVDEKTNEITAVQTVLEKMLLAGRVTPMDRPGTVH